MTDLSSDKDLAALAAALRAPAPAPAPETPLKSGKILQFRKSAEEKADAVTTDEGLLLRQLQAQQQDFYLDLQTLRRVMYKQLTGLDERLGRMERIVPGLDQYGKRHEQYIQQMADEIDSLGQQGDTLNAAMQLLTDKAQCLESSNSSLSTAVDGLKRRRFTVGQLILASGFVGVILTLLFGQLRESALSTQIDGLQHDIGVLYENDKTLHQQFHGGGAEPH